MYRFCRAPLIEAQAEGPADSRDVLVEALGELVAGETLVRAGQGNADRLDELARTQVLAPIVEEEVLQRDLAGAVLAAQRQLRAKRDQRRRQVADGRPVGDIAADCGDVADLRRTEAA